MSEGVTVDVGLGGNFGFVYVGDRSSLDAVGGILGQIGIEALMARDFMLFVMIRGGYGFSRQVGEVGGLFQGPAMLHAYAGLAYLL